MAETVINFHEPGERIQGSTPWPPFSPEPSRNLVPMTRTEVDSPTSTSTPDAHGPLPDFVVIGAMKAGTTTLFEYLCQHPDVFMCTPKEPQYFSRNQVFEKGEKYYRSLFREREEHQICGEASTCYTRAPHYEDAAGRMAELIPGARLIYILRHPVERTYSHYKWIAQQNFMQGNGVEQTFEEALEATSEYVDSSHYMLQIERYLEHFPREQLHVLTLDDLKATPRETLMACQEFLELPARDLTAEGEIRANQHGGERVANYHAKGKIRRLRQHPAIKFLRGILPKGLRDRGRELIRQRLASSDEARQAARQASQKLSPLTPSTRQELLERFEEPNRALEAFLGRSLPESWSR